MVSDTGLKPVRQILGPYLTLVPVPPGLPDWSRSALVTQADSERWRFYRCGPSLRSKEDGLMSNDPSAQRAIEEAAGYVRDTVRHFTDRERKQILEIALRELN